MKKLLLALAVLLCLGIFAKPLICLGVRFWVLPDAKRFDFESVHLSKTGAFVEGLVIDLPLGQLSIETFHIPFSRADKKVMRGIDIQAKGFDPHPNLWFLKLGIDLEEGKIWFDHLQHPIFFAAVDGILKLSPEEGTFPLLLSGAGYQLNRASLPWLSKFLRWPCQFTEGVISGNYVGSHEFDVELSDFHVFWKGVDLSAHLIQVNDEMEISLEKGHITYREFDQDIQMSRKEDGELCIKSGDLNILASCEKNGTIEGIIDDVVVFTWDGKEGMIRGTAIPEELYGELLKLYGASGQIKGLIDLEAWYKEETWTVDLVSYQGAYFSPSIEVVTEGPISHAYSYSEGVWSGSSLIQGAAVRIPKYELNLAQVEGEVYVDPAGIGTRNLRAYLGDLPLSGEVRLDFDGKEGVLSLNIDPFEGHLSDVKGLIPFDFPLEGNLTGHLYRRDLKWGGALRCERGYGSKGDLKWEGVSFDVSFNEGISVKNGTGDLVLSGRDEPILYHGALDRLIWDTELGKGTFDARVEKSTHDIFRLAGTFDRESIYLNPEHSHFFGAKIAAFEAGYLSRSGSLVMDISCGDLINHFEFLQGCGALPAYDLRKYDLQGDAKLKLSYKDEHLHFALTSEEVHCAKKKVSPFLIQGEVTPQEVAIDKLHINELIARLLVSKEDEGWSLTALEMNYRDSFLKSNEGSWHSPRGGMTLSTCSIELADFFPSWNGRVSLEGPIQFDLLRHEGQASFSLAIDHLSEGDLSVKSQKMLDITYSKEQGFELNGVELTLRSGALWADIALDKLKYNSVLQGEGALLKLPPEMCLHLAEAGLIPCQREGNSLVFSGVPVKWENQIEARGNFRYDKSLFIQGEMKDAYYWIGERSWPLQKVKFGLDDHTFEVSFKTEYQKIPAHVRASLKLEPQFALELALSDEKGRTLKITGHHHQLIQKVEGEIWGLSANFHHHGKGGLIGLLKVNLSELLEVLPAAWREKLEPLEIGAGYEIAGEISLTKDFQFDGHLKGRDFQLFGSRLKSMMGALHIDRSTFHLTDLRLSDEALTLSLPELLIKEEGQKWKLTIPEIMLQDFRPSLLRKMHKYRGKIKPFIIRELKFEHIEGILGEKESFIGHGGLYFTNTFKTEVHFFDIPFELIARIGLDPRLLVPVRGTLDFEMRNGKIFLTELKHAHSEGKCSKFYLSQTRPSFITLDGQLDISIKMRQYVILKVTEPFILSIQGSVNQPKYSLR